MTEHADIYSTASAKLRPWLIWTLGCIFYFYEFLLQVSPSVMGTSLMSDFSVSAHGLGILSGVYFLSYAGMQIPAGILLDRIGPHRLLTAAVAVCAVSSLTFGITEHFYAAVIARFMIGLGSAFAFVGTLKLIANWFPPERFALLTGLLVTVGMFGAISGESPLAYMISHIGWRNSMSLLGSIGLILAIIIFLVIRDYPDGKKPAYHSTSRSVIRDLIHVIKNKQLWLVAIYGGLMYMPTPTLCGLWGVPFLMTEYHLSPTTAAATISLIFFGWAVGSPLWGGISDKIGRRLPPMIIAAFGAPLTLSIAVYGSIHYIIVLQLLLFLFGLFSCAFLPSFSIAKELNTEAHCATALSFMNMMNMVGVSVAQPALGRILDALWDGKIADNVRVYSSYDYKFAIAAMLAVMLITLVILPFIKDTYARSIDAIKK